MYLEQSFTLQIIWNLHLWSSKTQWKISFFGFLVFQWFWLQSSAVSFSYLKQCLILTEISVNTIKMLSFSHQYSLCSEQPYFSAEICSKYFWPMLSTQSVHCGSEFKVNETFAVTQDIVGKAIFSKLARNFSFSKKPR